jgi:xanthine dehydrogenase accessory factor
VAPDIHKSLVEFADRGRAFALALVLGDVGHTPRKAGTQALIGADGSILGTIGGGAVEARAQRCAVQAIRTGRPEVFEAVFEGATAADTEPICGGSMCVLVDPTAAARRTVYAQAAEALRHRRPGVLVTTVRPGLSGPEVVAQWLSAESATACAAFPGATAIRDCLASGTATPFVQPQPEGGGQLRVLVEPVLPPPLLVIAGGGHVGQALAWQADQVGFQVVIVDDRAEFTATALFPPGTTTRCGDIAAEVVRATQEAYVVIVTRGHQHDERTLRACVKAPLAYLGMIGSRRKVALIREALLASGAATEADLARVYAPVGLDLGAETVPEIAASIVAQLIAARRKGVAPRMPTHPVGP